MTSQVHHELFEDQFFKDYRAISVAQTIRPGSVRKECNDDSLNLIRLLEMLEDDGVLPTIDASAINTHYKTAHLPRKESLWSSGLHLTITYGCLELAQFLERRQGFFETAHIPGWHDKGHKTIEGYNFSKQPTRHYMQQLAGLTVIGAVAVQQQHTRTNSNRLKPHRPRVMLATGLLYALHISCDQNVGSVEHRSIRAPRCVVQISLQQHRSTRYLGIVKEWGFSARWR